MFKAAYTSSVEGLKEANEIMRKIYAENPKHWPHGLSSQHFDDGVYLIREASTGKAVGFCGFQVRDEVENLLDQPKEVWRKESGNRLHPEWDQLFRSVGCRHVKTGYYSIGILPEFRKNGFAKAALQKLISTKSAGVDRVKALIMASNKPSLALADALGVEKIVKKGSAGLMSRVGNLFRSPVAEGILGREARDLARSKGVQMFMDNTWFKNPNEILNIGGRKMHSHQTLNDLLSRIGLTPKFVRPGQKPNAGVLLSPTGMKIPTPMRKQVPFAEETRQFPHMMGEDVDKLREAQMLSGYIPQTESLGKFMRGSKQWSNKRIGEVRDKLTQTLGPNWILKPRGGAASTPGSLITEKTPLTATIMGMLRRDPHIAQQRQILEQVGPVQSGLDKLIGKTAPKFFQNINRGTREYRVHSMGGKVVPFATSPRGSASEYLSYYLRPWQSKRTSQIERYVQEALDRMPEKARKMGYGFDVGLDHYGRPFIIEANPAAAGSASGFVSLPMVSDAYGSAVKGQLPAYVKLRNAAYLAGAGGLGAAALNQPEQSRWDKIRAGFTQ